MTVSGSSDLHGRAGRTGRESAIIERDGTFRNPARPTEPRAHHEHANALPVEAIPSRRNPNSRTESSGGGVRLPADAGGRGTTPGSEWAGTDRGHGGPARGPIAGAASCAGRPGAGRRGPPAPTQCTPRTVAGH